MLKPRFTAQQVELLSILVHKAPCAAWQLSEDLGVSVARVSQIAAPLIARGYVTSSGHGYFPRVTPTGERVKPIPDGEENARMVAEFIAKKGVQKIPFAVGTDPEPYTFKKRRPGKKKG